MNQSLFIIDQIELSIVRKTKPEDTSVQSTSLRGSGYRMKAMKATVASIERSRINQKRSIIIVLPKRKVFLMTGQSERRIDAQPFHLHCRSTDAVSLARGSAEEDKDEKIKVMQLWKARLSHTSFSLCIPNPISRIPHPAFNYRAEYRHSITQL